jgi:cytochrome c oxidase subunit 2
MMNDVLDAAGPQAAHIVDLWWLMFWVCVAVFVVVMAMLGWALWRAPRSDAGTPPDVAPRAAGERQLRWSVGVGVVVSCALLIGLLVASVLTDRALALMPVDDALNVRVAAHQYWWEVVYDDPQPNRTFTTANELYIPVGRPVVVTLEADDVIHSFWIPNLHGKKDLIPGRVATIRLRADRPGEFRGRCAEYCGLQHAFMAFDVVAVSADGFAAWTDAQRKPAADPSGAAAQRGRELFLSGSCMLCHAIQGTTANGRKAPDLTHVASRAHLAAGRIDNTPQALAAWITDPQRIKAGVNMPAHLLPGDDLAALVAYLETLQ